MRDHLRGLRLCEAVVHRAIEVVGNLRNLAGSNQGADSDETPISSHGAIQRGGGGVAASIASLSPALLTSATLSAYRRNGCSEI